MGLFWNLIQQGQISDQEYRAESLEERVSRLEDQLEKQQELILSLLQILEENLQVDIDGDGQIG
ncbi:MAG: hypothetical protein P8J45_10355 [Phycisphaerales bacterium]|jgi:chaperonin cofactor prefoldin|nr:hypothetical protein [Phycisphaerales bacterium]